MKKIMEAIFWISVGIIFYTFMGYGIVITLLAHFKKKPVQAPLEDVDLPELTLMVAAYNEADIIAQKVNNCLALNYPADKLKIIFVTDGSDDGTPELIQESPQVQVLHQSARKGKIAAVNRAMNYIETPFVIFTDANVMVNAEGLRNMVSHFQNNLVGAVSGEKRVISTEHEGAASGEGLYWKYESYLKRKDAEWNSLVGSAGELFGIRSHLYKPVAEDCIIEDFVMTMGIAASGYKVAYEPNAIATETASVNVAEESKRKVRIAAGGIQAMVKLSGILGPLSHPRLFFQYFSHRVLRWTLMPINLATALISASLLVGNHWTYDLAFAAQLLFYALTLVGYFLRNQNIKLKGFFTPYYFIFMHLCVVKGWFRYFNGSQKVTWEKARRASFSPTV